MANQPVMNPAPQSRQPVRRDFPDHVQNQQKPKFASDFFAYNVQFLTLTFGTTQTASIQIQADSDFEIQKLTAFFSLDLTAKGSAADIVPVSVLVTDTGNSRQLSDIAVPLSSWFGSAQLPFILPNTKIMRARAVLSIQVSNFGTNAADSVPFLQLSFIGRKIFRGENAVGV